jgi:hypothetical protein
LYHHTWPSIFATMKNDALVMYVHELSWIFNCVCLFIWYRVFLSISRWPQTSDLPASISWVLILKEWSSVPRFNCVWWDENMYFLQLLYLLDGLFLL